MIITNLTIAKVDKADPRYPPLDVMERGYGDNVPFSDVYLCSLTTDDGRLLEESHFVTLPMAHDSIAGMLNGFAAAILRAGDTLKAELADAKAKR